jgi:hypothetical protein
MKGRVKRALIAIENATIGIKRARASSDEGGSDFDKALRELSDSETDLRKSVN